MKIKKYVINLDHRPDRLNEFFSRYARNDVERFSAVNGKTFNYEGPLSEIEKIILLKTGYGKNVWPGAFGCWMSHVNLWQKLIEAEEDAFVIFEDDAFFAKNHLVKIDKIISYLDLNLFDVVYLGGRSREEFSPRDFLTNWSLNKDCGEIKFYAPLKRIFGQNMDRTTHSYIITKKGAEKLINEILFENVTRFPAIDGWLNQKRTFKNMVDVFPHICWSPINYKSDIR